MARTFDGVDDQIAFGSEAAIDDVAVYTAFALIRITGNVVDERTVLSKFKSDYSAGKLFISLAGNGVFNNKVFTLITTSAGSIASESAADVLVVNTWRAIVTTWDGTVNVGPTPKIYAGTIGGAIAEVSYTSQDDGSGLLTSLDASASLRVGTRDPLDTFFAGGLAECALWNRVLTADEIRALGRGFAPAFFPRGRVFYSLIDGRHSPEINMAGTTHGTVTGTTFLDHPPVIYPRQMGVQVPTVGGSSFKAAWARGSNVVIGSGAR